MGRIPVLDVSSTPHLHCGDGRKRSGMFPSRTRNSGGSHWDNMLVASAAESSATSKENGCWLQKCSMSPMVNGRKSRGFHVMFFGGFPYI